jgi:SNF2 family DNA or RNA helicase
MEPKFQAFLGRNKLERKPFQADCFKWCIKKEQAQQVQAQQVKAQPEQAQQQPQQTKQGGILALEMGLGKTIIMLGLVKCNVKAHTLIVLPLSLLDQWEKSIIKFCVCQPLIYHGSRAKSLKLSLEQIKTYPIVLTTYGQVSLPSLKQANKGRQRSRLHEITWSRLICDEAHHVSHKKTNEFKGVQALKAELCWLVTGTPLQNNEKELYNLYSIFGLTNSSVYYDAGENYTNTFKQMIFYKTKTGAGLALPPLHEHAINVEWSNPVEQEFAAHIHSLLTFCHVPKKPLALQVESETDNLSALRMKYMSRAQQVCVYPPMLDRAISQFENMLSSLQGTDANEYGEIDQGILPLSQSKIDAVLETLLERKGNGCGKIVFCHYYAEIDILKQRLYQADPTLQVSKFDGRVPNSKRAELLQKPVDILLAQIKMCREGLNLQDNYSEVYFPTPHFNPATEQQAIARCWRMGQLKPVNVFRYSLSLGVGAVPLEPPLGVEPDREGGAAATQALEPPVGAEPVREGRDTAAPVALMGVQGAEPLTMDVFTTKLHIKKQKFVERMATAAAHITPLPKKIKIKYIKK